MGRVRQPTAHPAHVPGPVERAVIDRDDIEALDRILARNAQMLDESDGARDIKSLSTTLMNGIKMRRELLEAAGKPVEDEPEAEGDVIDFFREKLASGT